MRDYNFLKNKFIEKHKIDDFIYLERYIKLILEYQLGEYDKYTEKHHILPKSFFPEFEDDDWNIIELKYEDHVNLHLLLFKSINIRAYQRPLNWMLKVYKNKEETSNAAKIGWINLKNNKEKYDKWRIDKSESMKKITSREQRRRAYIFWNNITDDEYIKFCNKMKEYWTEERKKDKSKQMNDYYLNPENIEKKRIETQERWDLMSQEDRDEFNSKMNIINKSEEKRRVSGEKIKVLWKNEEYSKKMKNRTHNPGKKIKIIKPNGEEVIVENMRKFEKEYNFSSHLIRKYRDKDIYINEIDLKGDKLLLDCKIESL
jgi:hypothetical protein